MQLLVVISCCIVIVRATCMPNYGAGLTKVQSEISLAWQSVYKYNIYGTPLYSERPSSNEPSHFKIAII